MAASQVAFQNTPGDVRVPIFMAELNAGPPSYSSLSRVVVIGRALALSAVLTAGGLINVGSMDPSVVAGQGSIGADMLLQARRRNPLGEIWFLNAGDPVGAAPATGTLALAGTATAPGTLVRYVAGERYAVGVGIGDTATVVGAALAARINAGFVKFDRTMGAPVVATAATGTVTLTARHTGVEGNSITILAGLDGDEVEVPGLTVTPTAMANGTGEVDLAAVLAKLGAQPFDFIISPYASVAQLNAVRDFLSDSGAGRWSPLVGLQGHYFSGKEGGLSTLTAFGQTRNDRHVTLLGLNKMPQAPWSYIAAMGGEVAFRKNLGRSLKEAIEIARPMQTLVMEGLRPPQSAADTFGTPDRDSLLRNGISTYTITGDGQIALDRIITTYRVNASGLPDKTFLDIEAVFIGAYVIRYLKNALLGTYPRHVLMEDNPGNIQGVATPAQLRGCVIHAYTDLNRAGLVRQVELFAAALVVDCDFEQDRANFYIPASKAAALRDFAANVTLFSNLTDTNASGL